MRPGARASEQTVAEAITGAYRDRWSVVKAVGLSFFLTFIPFFDIPVFWPILVIYFFALCFMTMRRQIAHMWKHKYIPFDIGKKKYTVRVHIPAQAATYSRPGILCRLARAVLAAGLGQEG